MTEFNELVDTDNTINPITVAPPPAAAAPAPVLEAAPEPARRDDPRGEPRRHPRCDRPEVLRQGEPLHEDLRGQPRHPARQPGPHQARPEAAHPRVTV